MAIYRNNKKVSAVFRGGRAISRIYRGEKLVFQSGTVNYGDLELVVKALDNKGTLWVKDKNYKSYSLTGSGTLTVEAPLIYQSSTKVISFGSDAIPVEIRHVPPIESSVNSLADNFMNYNKLEYVDISNWKNSAMSSFSRLFYACSSLKYADISGFDLSSYSSPNVTNMFYLCPSDMTIRLTGKMKDYLESKGVLPSQAKLIIV